METKIDPYTGEEFVPKRSNQKFATSKSKNDYHNRRSRKNSRRFEEIDKRIRKNCKILDTLTKVKKEHDVTKERLIGAGFHMDGFNVRHRYNGKIHSGVYNYTVVVIDDENFKIINNDR